MTRNVLGGERGRVGHRAAEADTCDEPKQAEHEHRVHEGDRERQDRECHHAAQERRSPAVAIAEDAAHQAADHHAEGPGGERVPERAVLDAPFGRDERHGVGKKLVVYAVEDDRERGPDNQKLLISRPASFIDHRADINRLHQVRSSMTWAAALAAGGAEVYQSPHMILS